MICTLHFTESVKIGPIVVIQQHYNTCAVHNTQTRRLNSAACVTAKWKKGNCPEGTPCLHFSSHQPSVMNRPAEIRAIYLVLYVFEPSCIFKLAIEHPLSMQTLHTAKIHLCFHTSTLISFNAALLSCWRDIWPSSWSFDSGDFSPTLTHTRKKTSFNLKFTGVAPYAIITCSVFWPTYFCGHQYGDVLRRLERVTV